MSLIINNKRVNKICIKEDNVPKEVNSGYIGIDGQSKLFYYKKNNEFLPEGYTQLEYITNNKNSYIVIPRNKVEAYSCDCIIPKTPNKYPTYNIFGTIGNSSLLYNVYNQTSSKHFTLYCNYRGTSNHVNYYIEYNTRFNFKYGVTINSQDYELVIDNDTENKSYKRASELSNEFLSKPLVLFANYNNSGNVSYGTGNPSIYSFKIYSDKTMNNLVVDLIPCKNSNSQIGFYDIKNGIFYTNANSQGNFIAGPEVVSTSS